LPARSRRGKWIDGRSPALPIDSEEPFKIRDFAADGDAGTQRVDDVRLLGDIRVGTEQRGQRIVFLKVVIHQELAQIASVETREPIQFEARDGSIPEFHLRNGRTGHIKVLGDIFLRESACFTCHTKSPAELLAAYGHLL
jgi:hypothetical protein